MPDPFVNDLAAELGGAPPAAGLRLADGPGLPRPVRPWLAVRARQPAPQSAVAVRSVGGAWGPVLPALPAVAVCLADASGPPAPSLGSVLERVLAHPVDRCAGLPACWPLALVVAYLACCTLIGRRVAVWPVDCEGADANVGPMVGGRVVGIGDDLSSQLDRADVPVAGGRLVFTDDGTVGDSGA